MRHIFDPVNGRLPNRTSRIVVGGTEAQNPPKALQNLHGIDIDTIGQPEGVLGLNDDGRLFFENANLNTLFPIPKAKGPASVYVNHKAHYLITNYDYNKEYTVSVIGDGLATLNASIVTYTAPNEPTDDGDGFIINGVDFPINVITIDAIDQVLEPSITIPNTATIQYSETLYRFESTEFRYVGALQHHSSSSWEIASDVDFTNTITSVTDSENFKTAWELADLETAILIPDTDYYIRVRHTGNLTGNSTWSSFVKFKVKQEFQTELPYVKTPSIVSYSPTNTSLVHPPFIMYGTDIDPNSMATYRSIRIGTDGYASACSLSHTAILNSVQHIKNPYINYPSVGTYYDNGISVNAIASMPSELWLVGQGIAKYNPASDSFTELLGGTDILIPPVYGLKTVCQHGNDIYAIGRELEYIYKYYDIEPIPEFKPIARRGLPILDYSGVTVSNGDVYACGRYGGIYKKPSGLDNFELHVDDTNNWSTIADINGVLYAAIHGGDIYKYNETTHVFDALGQGNRYWSGLTWLGTDIYASVYGGYIYKQTNGTGNFVSVTDHEEYWGSIYSDGTHLYGTTDYNYDIYIQYNAKGPFFSLTLSQHPWMSLATLGNGDTYGCVENGDIYVRTQGSYYFLPLNQTNRAWHSLAVLGNDIYACVYDGDIYKQTNGTGDFVSLSQGNKKWSGLATVGSTIYACVEYVDIYVLNTGNSTFEPLNDSSRFWQGLAYCNGNVYAVDYETGIYEQTNATGTFNLILSGSKFKDIITVGSNVYACVSSTSGGGGIYKKTGSGNFTSLSQTARLWASMFVDGGDVYATAWQYISGGYKYVLYKQTNGAGSFIAVSPDNTAPFSCISKSGNDLYVSGTYAIYKKQPNETAFTEVTTLNEGGADSDTVITHLYMDGSTVYVSTSTTIHSSTNGVSDLNPIGQTRARWSDLCSSNGTLYASESSLGVYAVNTIDGTAVNIHDSSPNVGTYSSLATLDNKLYFTAGHIYKETNTPHTFSIEDDTQTNFIQLAGSDDHMFVRTSDAFIYKQTNGADTFDLIVNDLSEITSMAVLNNVLYTHINWVNGYIPVQNGLGRYSMDGVPIYDDKTLMGEIFYKHALWSSAFESIGGPQDHVSSSWQIAVDNQFHNVVYESDKDTVYKTNIELSGLVPDTTYYARIKHTGSIWGDSEWSSAYSFTFNSFTIGNDDFYDLIFGNQETNFLGEIKHSVVSNLDGTVVAIGFTEVQYEGYVDTDAGVFIYKKVNGHWSRDTEFTIPRITQYGLSMAMNRAGNKLFVGAPFDGSYGTVYFYEGDGTDWYESNIFEDPIGGSDEGGGSECFGCAVACNAEGNRLAVGRSAVNGAFYTGLATNGSVHVYDLQLNGLWSDPKNLVANDPQLDSGFGLSLSMSDDGHTLTVGAPRHNYNLGKAYIFYYADSNWSIDTTVLPHDTDLDISFGQSVALSGDSNILYVGAPNYDNSADPNNILTNAGCVYIYQKDPITQDWYVSEQWIHYVAEEYFGKSLSVDYTGFMVTVATDYKTFIYQKTDDGYILNSTEPLQDIDSTTFGRIYTKANAISGSGTRLVQSLKYTDAYYNSYNYIHIKTLSPFNSQNHIGTDWQIASDYKFTNILASVTNDPQQKETYLSPAIFPMQSVFYVRARYNSENIGYTKWSLPMAVTTVGEDNH